MSAARTSVEIVGSWLVRFTAGDFDAAAAFFDPGVCTTPRDIGEGRLAKGTVTPVLPISPDSSS